METDKLYLLWGFINNVFWDSPVQAISKEKGSRANADARNGKRLMPALKQASSAKHGYKMDTIYLDGDKELGCLEIGGTSDTLKAMKDGQMKMPIVKKDTLLRIAKTTNAHLTDIRILGYNISGNQITLMVLHAPHGNVVRLRRSAHGPS